MPHVPKRKPACVKDPGNASGTGWIDIRIGRVRMTIFRLLIAFLVGSVFGAAALFLWLQTAGKLRPVAGGVADAGIVELPAQPSGIPVPVEPLKDALPAPASPPESFPRFPAAESLAIPVAGVKAEDLADHFLDTRGGGRPHHAIDIMAARGTPVVAAVDGTVRKLHLSVPGGITLYQTDVREELIYYYAHLDAYAPGMTEGRKVRRGEVIGFVGSTGNAQDPHLHFSISRLPPTKEWWKGVPINPHPVLRARGVTVQSPVSSR